MENLALITSHLTTSTFFFPFFLLFFFYLKENQIQNRFCSRCMKENIFFLFYPLSNQNIMQSRNSCSSFVHATKWQVLLLVCLYVAKQWEYQTEVFLKQAKVQDHFSKIFKASTVETERNIPVIKLLVPSIGSKTQT